MSVAPVVRRVIVCRKVEVTNPGPNQEYAIRGPMDVIRPRVGLSFPYAARGLWLFAQFTDGQGVHPVKLDVIRLDDGVRVGRYPLPPVRMTQGRLTVLSRGYRLPAITIPDPGVYEFRVVCGGSAAADVLRVEDST